MKNWPRWLRWAVRLSLLPLTLLLLGSAAYLTGPSALEVEKWPQREGWTGTPSVLSWQDVWAMTGPRIRWTALDTGGVHLDVTQLMAPSPGRDEARAEAAELRVYAHLLQHPKEGTWLVDAGLDDTFADDKRGNLSLRARFFAAVSGSHFSQTPGTDLLTQLAAHQVAPGKLGGVFVTHLHFDHTAGLPALPATVPVIVGPGESADLFGLADAGHLDNRERIHELDFTHARALPPFERCVDVFGDASLWAVHTPGHSAGHLSFVVRTDGRPVLLVGDASHFEAAWRHDVPPSGSQMGDEARHSFEALRRFAEAHDEVVVFWGHQAPPAG